jgi:large subunit ribosomal protein L4
MAGVLSKLKINRSCLLTLPDHDDVLYKSARNIPDITVTTAAGLNAFDVATRMKLLVTREAMDVLLGKQA